MRQVEPIFDEASGEDVAWRFDSFDMTFDLFSREDPVWQTLTYRLFKCEDSDDPKEPDYFRDHSHCNGCQKRFMEPGRPDAFYGGYTNHASFFRSEIVLCPECYSLLKRYETGQISIRFKPESDDGVETHHQTKSKIRSGIGLVGLFLTTLLKRP